MEDLYLWVEEEVVVLEVFATSWLLMPTGLSWGTCVRLHRQFGRSVKGKHESL